jgi:hypothetical protein
MINNHTGQHPALDTITRITTVIERISAPPAPCLAGYATAYLYVNTPDDQRPGMPLTVCVCDDRSTSA